MHMTVVSDEDAVARTTVRRTRVAMVSASLLATAAIVAGALMTHVPAVEPPAPVVSGGGGVVMDDATNTKSEELPVPEDALRYEVRVVAGSCGDSTESDPLWLKSTASHHTWVCTPSRQRTTLRFDFHGVVRVDSVSVTKRDSEELPALAFCRDGEWQTHVMNSGSPQNEYGWTTRLDWFTDHVYMDVPYNDDHPVALDMVVFRGQGN